VVAENVTAGTDAVAGATFELGAGELVVPEPPPPPAPPEAVVETSERNGFFAAKRENFVSCPG
jgi:hypothetical protein